MQCRQIWFLWDVWRFLWIIYQKMTLLKSYKYCLKKLNSVTWCEGEQLEASSECKGPLQRYREKAAADKALTSRKLTLNSIPAGPLQIFCSKMIDRSFIQVFYGTYIIWIKKYLGNFKILSQRSRVENWDHKKITSFRRKLEYQSVTRQLRRPTVFFILKNLKTYF